jgi:hypothetical protein
MNSKRNEVATINIVQAQVKEIYFIFNLEIEEIYFIFNLECSHVTLSIGMPHGLPKKSRCPT